MKRIGNQLLMALFLSILILPSLRSQDDWEPSVHFTGYINTVLEYHSYADTSATGPETPQSFGWGLSDAAFLVSYKPLEKLEFKTTAVYTPWVNRFQDFFIEIYGAYTFSPSIRIAAGKFLTPLSPGNLDFFAPLNNGISLPMVISHHTLFPQSFSGLQVGGELGSGYYFGYMLTYGSYQDGTHPQFGVIGVRGREDFIPPVGENRGSIEIDGRPPRNFMGGAARVFFRYEDMFGFGINLFEGSEGTTSVYDPVLKNFTEYFDASRRAYGIDMQINIGGFEFNGEYWKGTLEADEKNILYSPAWSPEPIPIKIEDQEFEGYYADLAYTFNTLTPWFRYEYIEDAKTQHLNITTGESPMSSYGFGIKFQPFFETQLKLEYRRLLATPHVDKKGLLYEDVGKFIEDYDLVSMGIVLSF